MDVLVLTRKCWAWTGVSLPENPTFNEWLNSLLVNIFILGVQIQFIWYAMVIFIWERDITPFTVLLLVALHIFAGISYFGPYAVMSVSHKQNIHKLGETVENIVNESKWCLFKYQNKSIGFCSIRITIFHVFRWQ